MPRTFTRQELYTTTQGQYDAMSTPDQRAYDDALIFVWANNAQREAAGDAAYDYRQNGIDGTDPTPCSGV